MWIPRESARARQNEAVPLAHGVFFWLTKAHQTKCGYQGRIRECSFVAASVRTTLRKFSSPPTIHSSFSFIHHRRRRIFYHHQVRRPIRIADNFTGIKNYTRLQVSKWPHSEILTNPQVVVAAVFFTNQVRRPLSSLTIFRKPKEGNRKPKEASGM